MSITISAMDMAVLQSGGTVSLLGPPSAPPPVTLSRLGAQRLLAQATMQGANRARLDALSSMTATDWINAQIATPPTFATPLAKNALYVSSPPRAPLWHLALRAPDQLRQRVAFALSQIFVVSVPSEKLNADIIIPFWDVLVTNAFGSYHDLLSAVSRSMQMGYTLSSLRSVKSNGFSHADENFGREVMQLHSIGLWKLNADGSQTLDATGAPIPTYVQTDVAVMARVFTGWGSQPQGHTGDQAFMYDNYWALPMVPYEFFHDTGSKVLLDGTTLPAGTTTQADFDAAIKMLSAHPNTAPFIVTRLIKHLVMSNPPPAYIADVVKTWNTTNGGLDEVVTAILLHPLAVAPTTGKLREPILRLTQLWGAFDAASIDGGAFDYYQDQQLLIRAGENTLSSPTVFNFFTPDTLPGPEFGILNDYTLPQFTNMLDRSGYARIDSTGHAQAGYTWAVPVPAQINLLHTAQYEPLVITPTSLVAELDLILTGGQLGPVLTAECVTYAQLALSTPSNNGPANSPAVVITELATLIAQSPQAAIQI